MKALLLALLLATPALAADGDIRHCTVGRDMTRCQIMLCDGNHQSVLDCAEIDLGADLQYGFPDRLAFVLSAVTGCAATPDVTVRGLSGVLGVPHVYGTLTTAGVSTIAPGPPWHGHVDATVADTAGCTDLEVIIEAEWDRNGDPQ